MSIFDFNSGSFRPKRNRKLIALISVGAIVGAITLSTTLASKLTLNTNGRTEFGQGVMSTTSCDTNGILVTPINSFFNKTKAGRFTFNAIQFQHISANCAGKDFIIKVYNQNGEALEITRDGNNVFNEARVYFQPFTSSISISDNDGTPNTVTLSGYWANQFALVGSSPIVVGTLNNLIQMDPEAEVTPAVSASEFFELDLEENSFQITFDPTGELAAGFADSKNVYRISIESTDHVG
jgi:hypothetical protein